jgi:hypothetical protein
MIHEDARKINVFEIPEMMQMPLIIKACGMAYI